MRFTITHKLIFTTTFFFSAGIGVIFGFIFPSLNSITQTTDAMVAQVSADNEELERVRLLRRSLIEIDAVEEDLSRTTAISITKSEEEKLIELIEFIAERNGVDQELSVSYQPYDDATQFIGYYLFSFSTKGPLERIESYLVDLESIPYYLNIKGLTIEKNSKLGENHVVMTFRATLNTTSEPSYVN
ncbi:MAG: hypothetical protein KBD29_02870 [Candidatus Magasanikbacteria bacterium]|nr:hypothetical protein [Candidatus Magasanikbacteria bacterium]